MPAIEVEHLTKEYRLGALQSLKQTVLNVGARLAGRNVPERQMFKALNDVNFTIEQGEVVGVIGHNGAGKSTLLKMLARITKPTSGSVRVNGRVAPLIEVGAGFVPDFTGRENVYLNGAILGMSKREIDRQFEQIVDFAELAEFIDTPVKRYSSGMQVKLAFAVATSINSEILIVDEVLAVGDLAFQRKCFDRMESLIKKQGRTVLLVSHNLRQVERLCSRVMLLNRGSITHNGTPREVCNAFYAASDQRIHELTQKNSMSRTQSSGDIELQSVLLFNSNGPTTEICHLESIEVRIQYKVINTIPRPVFGIGVHTTDFLYLATSQSVDVLDVGQLNPGQYTLSFTIPQFPFLPGVYSLRIGVALQGSFQPIFYAENILPLHVTSQKISRATTTNQGDGFIDLNGIWELTSSALSTPDQ